MSPRPVKIKKSEWHKQSVDLKLAIGFLAAFAFFVAVYLIANFKSATSPAVSFDNPGLGMSGFGAMNGEAENKSRLKQFSSSDDFKSYLDDGKREFGDGFFETQVALLAGNAAASPEKSAVVKTTTKSQKTDVQTISAEDGQKYMNLGRVAGGKPGNLILAGPKNIYFSPENQFYMPAAAVNGGDQPAGETKIFDIGDPALLAQTGFAPNDGNLLAEGNTLAILSGNSISIYDVSSAFVPVLLWRARLANETQIAAAQMAGSKLYLALKTRIDAANPCPIKPLAINDKQQIIECTAISHPDAPILADSIFSVIEIDAASGAAGRNVSFVGGEDNSTVLISGGEAVAAWGQGGDYVSFFTGFLQDKCKGLLPNYLLEKAAKLPGCAISRAAKELELRSLISNWFTSLAADEQTRIAGEITARLSDYLRDHYRDFEQTGIARAGLDDFKFDFQNQIAGRLLPGTGVEAAAGNFRIATVSGNGAVKKMAWLVTGKIAGDDAQKTLSNVYVLGPKMEIVSAAESLDLPAGVCALRYANNAAYLSTCRQGDPVYAAGLAAGSAGVAGQLKTFGFPSYLYPFDDGYLLAVSKNGRKIKLSLYDAALPSKIEAASEIDVNDYWVDLDANYPAFASDENGKTFFLPAARGGYVFSRAQGKLELKKAVGDIAAGRALFKDGYLYLAGDGGLEVFGGADWAMLKSVKF